VAIAIGTRSPVLRHVGQQRAKYGLRGAADMLVTVGTLLGGLAVLAVAFEAPMAALALGAAAYWLLAHSV
jgi:hypothetical protein